MQPKNDKRTTVILISLFLFFAPLISANDWFMNPKGSQSSGCGTDKSNPCGILTLILNNEQFQANDTVYWQSGHYNPCSIQNLTGKKTKQIETQTHKHKDTNTTSCK